MLWRLAAFGVHAFTALGAIFGFQALIEAAAQRWEAAFFWLGLALIVDGADGPLARWARVQERLPRFSGERLDLIIDYLTYVVVPAYIIHEAGRVPATLAPVAAALILLTSLFHFIDRQSKTEDGYFVGFPALWNVFALYLMVFSIPAEIGFALLIALALLTFLPLKWIHPVRVERLRPITLAVIAAWAAAVLVTLIDGFPGSLAAKATIAAATIYLLAVGLMRSFRP
jgi:phosphatidylcholine synthase